MEDSVAGGRQLTAAEANALAQELDDRAAGREPAPADSSTDHPGTTGARPVAAAGDAGPSPEAATAGYKPLEGEEREARAGVYPPDVAPTVEIGGSPEERAQLAEEYKQDDEYRRDS